MPRRNFGLACVWLLLLFRERDVPGSFYWYYPYKGVDIERCLDGNDECLTGLSFDFRTCRIPKDGHSRGGYRFRHSRGGIDSLFVVYTRLTVDIRKYALNQIRSFDFWLVETGAGYFRVHDAAIFLVYRYLVYVLYRCGAFGATGVGGGEYRT